MTKSMNENSNERNKDGMGSFTLVNDTLRMVFAHKAP